MLEPGEADALLHLQSATRDQKRLPPEAPRRGPKVGRMQSGRMRTATSQTINEARAIYTPESQWNQTPLAPEGFVGTRNVGPSDMNRNGYNPAKATNSTEGGGYPRRGRRAGTPTRTPGQGRKTAADWSALADQYDID